MFYLPVPDYDDEPVTAKSFVVRPVKPFNEINELFLRQVLRANIKFVLHFNASERNISHHKLIGSFPIFTQNTQETTNSATEYSTGFFISQADRFLRTQMMIYK